MFPPDRPTALAGLLALLIGPAFADEPAPKEYELRADSVERSAEFAPVRASGNVQIRTPQGEIRADRAQWDPQTGQIVLEGQVHSRSSRALLQAERLDYNIPRQQARASDAELLLDERYRAQAAQISRDSQERFAIDQGRLTTCPGPCPDWSIGAASATADPQGVLEARDIRLYVRDWPLLAWPYLQYPLTDVRSTGLLLPRLQGSSHTGTGLELDWFQVLDQRRDATLTLGLYTGTGLLTGLEFRQLDALGGEMRLSWKGIDESDPRVQGRSWRYRTHSEYQLRQGGWMLDALGERASDFDFAADYQVAAGSEWLRDQQRQRSVLSLGHQGAWLQGYVRMERDQSQRDSDDAQLLTRSDRPVAMQLFPARWGDRIQLDGALQVQRLRTLREREWFADGDAPRIPGDREREDAGMDMARADLEAILPLAPTAWLGGQISLGMRGEWFGETRALELAEDDPGVWNSGQRGDRDAASLFPHLSTRLQTARLQAMLPGGLRHQVWLSQETEYLDAPRVDSREALLGTELSARRHRFSPALHNRLDAAGWQLRHRLSQQFSPGDFGQSHQGPLVSETRLELGTWELGWDLAYAVNAEHIERQRMRIAWQPQNSRLHAEHHYERDGAQNLRLGAELNLDVWDLGIELDFAGERSPEFDRALEDLSSSSRRLEARYRAACWSLDLGYEQNLDGADSGIDHRLYFHINLET